MARKEKYWKNSWGKQKTNSKITEVHLFALVIK